MGMHVNGFGALSARINAAQAAAVPLVRAVLDKSAADVTSTAQANAPVDTGTLRASYNRTSGGDAALMWSEVKPGVNYAIYVELGTSRMAPRPHLFPALDQHGPQFVRAVAAASRAVFGG